MNCNLKNCCSTAGEGFFPLTKRFLFICPLPTPLFFIWPQYFSVFAGGGITSIFFTNNALSSQCSLLFSFICFTSRPLPG